MFTNKFVSGTGDALIVVRCHFDVSLSLYKTTSINLVAGMGDICLLKEIISDGLFYIRAPNFKLTFCC